MNQTFYKCYFKNITMIFLKKTFFIAFLLQVTCTFLYAQNTVNLALFSADFAEPLAIENCGDDRLFIVEQRGRIYICDMAGNKNPTPFLDISDRVSQSGGELGLLGLAFDPNYAINGYFYVNYTAAADNNNTRIARFSRHNTNPDLAVPASEQLVLSIAKPTAVHNGGTLVFGPDNYLYICTGDGGGGGLYAQDMTSFLGKMLRIDVSNPTIPYTVPPDNPFVGISGILPEIWAWGLRNAWKFDFDPMNGNLWIADVGQDEREEINLQIAGDSGGQNYGWRCYEGSLPYNATNCSMDNLSAFTFPVYEYDHSMGCSITGGKVYRGAQFHDFYGKYIYADFCTGKIGLLSPDNNGGYTNEWITLQSYHQIVTLGQDQYGEFYLADYLTGDVYKLSAGNCGPTAVILGPESRNLCAGDTDTLRAAANEVAVNISYQWSRNALDIAGATQPELVVTQTGQYRLRTLKTNVSGCGKVSQIVNVTAAAPAPIISSSPSVCVGNGTVYSVVPTADHQYFWSISSGSGTIVDGQGTAAVTIVWNGGTAGSVTVVETNP